LLPTKAMSPAVSVVCEYPTKLMHNRTTNSIIFFIIVY